MELASESVITDEQWALVAPLLPRRRAPAARPANVDDRAVLAAIVHAVTTRTPWDAVPDVFGMASSTAYRRFRSWTDADLWRRLLRAANGTDHALWAVSVAFAAIGRAGSRALGWPNNIYQFPEFDQAIVRAVGIRQSSIPRLVEICQMLEGLGGSPDLLLLARRIDELLDDLDQRLAALEERLLISPRPPEEGQWPKSRHATDT
jgi:transposase